MNVRIISFAPEPADNSTFDDYGWSDEVYIRLPNFYGLLRFIWQSRSKDCVIASANLIYADRAE